MNFGLHLSIPETKKLEEGGSTARKVIEEMRKHLKKITGMTISVIGTKKDNSLYLLDFKDGLNAED